MNVTVNWKTSDLEMTLGSAGEAYFIIGETDVPLDGAPADELTLRRLAEEESIKFPVNLDDDDDPTTLNVESIEEAEILGTTTLCDPPFLHDVTRPNSLSPDGNDYNLAAAVANDAAAAPPRQEQQRLDDDSEKKKYRTPPGTSVISLEIDGSAASGGAVGGISVLTSPAHSDKSDGRKGVSTGRARAANARRFSYHSQVKASPNSLAMGAQTAGLDDIQIEASLCGHLLQGVPHGNLHDRDVFQANLLDWNALNVSRTTFASFILATGRSAVVVQSVSGVSFRRADSVLSSADRTSVNCKLVNVQKISQSGRFSEAVERSSSGHRA